MLAEPPQNGEYLAAAYLIAAMILIGYWGALWRRGKKNGSGEAKSVSGKTKSVSGKETT